MSSGLLGCQCADLPAAGAARIPAEKLRARMILEKNMFVVVVVSSCCVRFFREG